MIQIDFNNGVVQATPVAGAAAADAASRLLWGLTLNEWFYVSAILYTVVMTGLAIFKAVKETKPKGE
ncbi:type II holin [Pseudomonas oryzihabitans]|uniref:type II holin n=1 Tax=Pseudomonas oryzihabitans TaxID=47885 RepID=UPI0015E2EB36|nr:type II holin [Pseudomonas psychrotolerans]MBA1211525.1 type II holin [Pseudomonas psychrotolerans]